MSCHDSKLFMIEASQTADHSASVPRLQCVEAAGMPFLGLAFLSDDLVVAAGFDAEPFILSKQQGHGWSLSNVMAGKTCSFKPSECPIPASLKADMIQLSGSELQCAERDVCLVWASPMQSARPLKGSHSANDSCPRTSLLGWPCSTQHRRRR